MSKRFYAIPLFLMIIVLIMFAENQVNSNNNLFGAEVEVVSPESLGFTSDLSAKLDVIGEKIMANDEASGVVIAVGRGDKLAYLKSWGDRQTKPEKEPMRTDTIFDMASITKVMATGTAMAILYDEGKYNLEDPIAKYLPEFGTHGKEKITIKDCLLHVSGLSDRCFRGAKNRSSLYHNICNTVPVSKPGEKYKYQCCNFITLCFVVEKLSGQSLKDFTQKRIYKPLGMKDTMFCPDSLLKDRCISTEFEDGNWVKGVVHDPPARFADGIGGNAGLFSTAPDMALFAAMMIGHGTLQHQGKSVQIITPKTFALWTTAHYLPDEIHALAWDKKEKDYGPDYPNPDYSESAIGHSGFTGTSLWIDPDKNIYVILLGNRLHPERRSNLMNRRAAEVGVIVVKALSL